MLSVLFQVKDACFCEQARCELESLGLKDFYIIEEKNSVKIGGQIAKCPKYLEFSNLDKIFEGVDWFEQSKQFSPYYKNGLIEVDLQDFSKDYIERFFYLKPGAGFGDLSHPTTYLTLKMLSYCAIDQVVLDIGCGSGVLSFASYFLKAKEVIGLDICSEALKHANENLKLNPMAAKSISFKKNLDKGVSKRVGLIVMNMIFEEQKGVYKAYPELFLAATPLIVSGVIKGYEKSFFDKMRLMGYLPAKILEKDNWLAILLKK